MAHLRWLLGPLVCLAVLSLAPGARADDDAPDIVFLKNGGRVRGTVVEESPTAGVRIKLPTGTLKTVPAAEVDKVTYGGGREVAPSAPPAAPAAPAPAEPPPVAQAAPAATGSLHVDAAESGTVYVDGGEVGPTPADVKGLEPGTHRVRVVFAGGGKSEVSVLVQGGENKEVHLQLSNARKAGQAREGVRPVVSGEPFFEVPANGNGKIGGGVRFFGGMNLGIAPAVDFRVGGLFALSQAYGNFAIPLELRASFRFNLGALYSMEVGGHGGFTVYPGIAGSRFYSSTSVFSSGGPDLSVLSFRFGDKRQYEITEMTSVEIIDLGSGFGVQNSIGFAWVIPR